MAFLPEELGRAQEEPRAHFPTDDIGPLVDEDGQVAMALDPLAIHVPDDGLAGGAKDEWLFELLAAGMRDDGQLGGKSLDMLGLFFHEALGDEHGEVGVHVAGFLEALVEAVAHVLPKAVAVGADDHGSLHRRVVGQLGLQDDVRVPT